MVRIESALRCQQPAGEDFQLSEVPKGAKNLQARISGCQKWLSEASGKQEAQKRYDKRFGLGNKTCNDITCYVYGTGCV